MEAPMPRRPTDNDWQRTERTTPLSPRGSLCAILQNPTPPRPDQPKSKPQDDLSWSAHHLLVLLPSLTPWISPCPHPVDRQNPLLGISLPLCPILPPSDKSHSKRKFPWPSRQAQSPLLYAHSIPNLCYNYHIWPTHRFVLPAGQLRLYLCYLNSHLKGEKRKLPMKDPLVMFFLHKTSLEMIQE